MATLERDRMITAEQALADVLAQYAGEWVAVRQHAVVAHAATLKELREQIAREKIEGIERVFRVPEGDADTCFFF